MPVDINQDDFDKIIPQLRRSFQRSHDLTAQELWGNLREFSPQDHGRLAGSWVLQRGGFMESSIGTSVKYALVQNDGSDPYEIFPRNTKALRFVVGGEVVFAKSIMHPGVPGTKYIDKSIEQAESRVSEFVQMALEEEGL